MATLLLNANGDLDITTGKVVVTTDVQTEYRQKVQARLQSFKGEWTYDLDHGVPYFERVFIKNPQIADIKDIFRRTILSVPGGAAVQFSLFDFNYSTRMLSFTFQVTTDFSATPLDFTGSLDLFKDVT